MNTLEYLRAQKPDEHSMIVLDWIRTEFNLPPSIAEVCTQHFLRVWYGNFAVSHVTANGMLNAVGEDWIVHWQSTPAVCRSANRVALSFREYNSKRYVVIKVWKEQA